LPKRIAKMCYTLSGRRAAKSSRGRLPSAPAPPSSPDSDDRLGTRGLLESAAVRSGQRPVVVVGRFGAIVREGSTRPQNRWPRRAQLCRGGGRIRSRFSAYCICSSNAAYGLRLRRPGRSRQTPSRRFPNRSGIDEPATAGHCLCREHSSTAFAIPARPVPPPPHRRACKSPAASARPSGKR